MGRITIRISEKLHKWIVDQAKRRHTTVSAVIQDALQRARDMQVAEIYARAALRAICEAQAGSPEEARAMEARYLGQALREAQRAKGEVVNEEVESENHPDA